MPRKRKDFSVKTKKQAFIASCIDGVPWCAICEMQIKGTPEYDHEIPDAFACDLLGYEINDLRNCQVLCSKCHSIKTKDDVKDIARADRLKNKEAGIKPRKRKMGYRKFDGTVVPPRWE